MADYRLTSMANRDLRRIRDWLTREATEEVADHVEAALFHGFEELARLPWIGHRRSDVPDTTVLFYNVFEYAVVFRRVPELLILRVSHGKRDLKNLI